VLTGGLDKHLRDADDTGGESYDRSLGMVGSVSGLLGADVPNRNTRSAADGAQPPARYAADVGRGSGRELGGIRNCCGIATRSLWMIVLAQILWTFATTGSVIHLIQYLINKESTALYRNTLVRSVMRFNRRAFRLRAGKSGEAHLVD
jgi:hypothetical protein